MIGPDRKQLSGLVEVDETFIGGAKSGKRGRGAEGKTLVLVVVEDHDDAVFGQVRLQTVPDASGKSLNNFIKASSVRTDGWREYSKVDELGYEHIVSGGRDSEEAVGEDPSPLCHRVISLLKRSLLNPYQGAVHPAQLDRYLEEFAFRFNRRKSKSRGLLFLRLLQHAVENSTIPGQGNSARPSRLHARHEEKQDRAKQGCF